MKGDPIISSSKSTATLAQKSAVGQAVAYPVPVGMWEAETPGMYGWLGVITRKKDQAGMGSAPPRRRCTSLLARFEDMPALHSSCAAGKSA
eukprot:4277948-Pleurochrysis_carterae.AAC.1